MIYYGLKILQKYAWFQGDPRRMRTGMFRVFVLTLVVATLSTLAKAEELFLDGPQFARFVLWKSQDLKLQLDATIPLKGRSRFLFGRKLLSNLVGGLPFTLSGRTLSAYRHGPARTLLSAFIISQRPASLRPDDLFIEALRIQKGSVFEALELIWNLLSEEVYNPERNRTDVGRRLFDIRGDADAFRKSELTGHWRGEGDNYSAWYHFFGVFVLAFTLDQIKPIPVPTEWIMTVPVATADMLATPLDLVFNSQFLALLDIPKRTQVDWQAARAGALMSRLIRRGSSIGAEQPSSYLYKRHESPTRWLCTAMIRALDSFNPKLRNNAPNRGAVQ